MVEGGEVQVARWGEVMQPAPILRLAHGYDIIPSRAGLTTKLGKSGFIGVIQWAVGVGTHRAWASERAWGEASRRLVHAWDE